MANLVLDASIAAAWCFKEETTQYTNGVLLAVSEFAEAAAPGLWAYEIRNSVLMGVRRNRLTRSDAEEFLDSIPDLRISLIDPPSYGPVFTLAERHGLTFYDAAYLELAIREGLPLASLDAQLMRAAGHAGVSPFQI